jgi:catechol 2,3-dioxygenase-like lactoylglutathione lyase family enzyme
VGRFLARQGPGLHHVAYQVQDIEATLERLRAAGLELIDEHPRAGIRGSRVAFLHPRSSAGVLTEIVQPAGAHGDAQAAGERNGAAASVSGAGEGAR